jgi:dTDP-4-dehydrorhamnose reductase
MERKRILVTGASGLLGRALMRRFSADPAVQVLGTGFTRAAPPLVALDLRSPESVQRLIDDFQPEVILHAAAERRPDRVEREAEASAALNVRATADLARMAAVSGARMIYVSTDYVFDGVNPPFRADSRPNPLNLYGRMKLEGESAVAAAGGDWALLRIPILYGPSTDLGESPITEILSRWLKDPHPAPFKVDDWATRYPAHVDDVARALAMLCFAPSQGIHQFASIDRITKYQMASIMARMAGLDTACIIPDSDPPAGALRPRDCALDPSTLEALGFHPAIDFTTGIRPILQGFFPAAFDAHSDAG